MEEVVGAAVPEASPAVRRRGLRRRVVGAVVVLLVAWVAWTVVQRLVADVSWSAVGAAFARCEAWLVLPLAGGLLLRQALNAYPLTAYVPGLGWWRSGLNDVSANVVAAFSPPPTDIVLRVRMFRDWGVDPVVGMTGVTLNSITFYAVRFVSPALGVLLLGLDAMEAGRLAVAGACLLVAAVLLAALVLLLRSDGLAAWLGRTGGRAVRVVRRSVDPVAWGTAAVELRGRSAASLRRGLLPSMLALVGMVLTDGAVLLVALRGVGVPVSVLPTAQVLGAFLVVYPLTLLPLFGFGVLDALLVGALAAVAGAATEPDLLAAAVVWRVVTILGTFALGLGALGLWRLGVRRAHRGGADQPDRAASEGA